MPSKQLGSLAIQAPALTPQLVHVTPSTCHDLSMFKDLMREYRKLDDSITMRLNRSNAQFRDRDRLGLGAKGNVQEQACAHLWKELIDNWKRRMEIVDYCVDVVDKSMEQKQSELQNKDVDPAGQRRIQGALYAEQVKRNQIHNELTVEKIIRHRSLDAFRSRCRYFEPSDTEGRRWWDRAHESD
ncbi:hypothetical protein QCA50_000625 [Cerrena zonata]|uniref:Caffeine-induced death protein 2 n=1 Tax=Cerrena zonata TaxID=2478898 RepID=A0AAW0GRX5_9APHY